MATSPEAIKLYNFIKSNYGKKVMSGTTAYVDWNLDEADRIGKTYGKTPLINMFDYIHTPFTWRDYTDITPVKQWVERGGIVAIQWHWSVPKKALPGIANIDNQLNALAEDPSNFDIYTKDSNGFIMEFDPNNVLKSGTWENAVYEHDINKVISYLMILQDAHIPVLWRPYPEASGEWFWWGARGPALHKRLWMDMVKRFRNAQLDNIIWVWTLENKNWGKWYPGGDYVDIVGDDIYGLSAEECITSFKKMSDLFPDKMLALSEIGYGEWQQARTGKISHQMKGGAMWSWFTVNYEQEGNGINADADWWNDAMNNPDVLWLGDFKLADDEQQQKQ